MNDAERVETEITIELIKVLTDACSAFPTNVAGVALLKSAAAQVVRETGWSESMAFGQLILLLEELRRDAS